MNITATEVINVVSHQHTTNITGINNRSLQALNELHGTSYTVFTINLSLALIAQEPKLE